VLYWVQYYYKHPEADLLKLAVESLLKERMKPEGTIVHLAWRDIAPS
jgi:hypothetical protein